MEETRVIEVKQEILAENSAAAAFRARLKAEGTFYIDVMSGSGAGKTTLLLALIERLRNRGDIGIIEADLESLVDSRKIKEAGVPAVQLETNNICHVEMGMVESAWRAFQGRHSDYLFLENIGNLVCRRPRGDACGEVAGAARLGDCESRRGAARREAPPSTCQEPTGTASRPRWRC